MNLHAGETGERHGTWNRKEICEWVESQKEHSSRQRGGLKENMDNSGEDD